MEGNVEKESTLVHSPRSHYHSQFTKKSLSSSDSDTGNEGSDVSDIVVDDVSRFKGLSKERRKSGGSDYRLPSKSNSVSESESDSSSDSSNESCSTRSTPFSVKRNSPNTRLSEEGSEGTSRSRSISTPPHRGPSCIKEVPMVRKSPLNVSHRSNPSQVTNMRGYRYSMLPSRSAAMNVSYSRYLEEESDSDDNFAARKPARRRQLKESESEFEVSGASEQSASEGISNSEDFSEDEYQPPRRKARGLGRKRKDWEGSGSDSDYLPGHGKRRGKGGRRPAVSKNDGYTHSFVSDGGTTASSSESEFEPGYSSKQRKKKKQKKQKRMNRDFDSPSDYVRTTGRSRGVVSYKNFYGSDVNDSEKEGGGEEVGEGEGGEVVPLVEDNRETIEKILKKRIGKIGDTGDKTTCYARCLELGSDPTILAHIGQGDKDYLAKLEFSFNTPSPAPGQLSEVQYLVKWRNWSHLHNTWETEASLASKDIRGMKKFYNFLKREEERESWERTANMEDIEYFKCQEELGEQLLANFTQVERVIASRASEEGGQEYLCKWWGLPYSECTWEDSNLISSWFQSVIDTFIERNTSDRIPNKNAKVLRHRPKFVYMKEQLRSLGGHDKLPLRDYQLEGVNWLVKSWCKNNSVILADEMGLGKTIQTIAFLHCLFHNHQLYGPYLVVVPLSTLPGWQREFELWAPEMNTVIYIGDVHSRSKIREFEWSHANKKLKFNSIITTYEILLKDKEFLGSVAWTSLIVDEAHRLKNDDSLLYRTLMEFRTNYRLLITGTPLQNSLKELWSLLHFIMERKFPSWEDFEYENHAYGEGDASTLTSIHQELQPFLLRRMKKDVEKSLPAKVEQILRVEMSSVQKQYYRWILAKNYKALSRGVKGSITGFINIMMELKKCCNHVWIVRSPDEKEEREKDKLQTLIRGSGKLYLLDKLLVRLNKTGHRVLIFSQMVRMLDVLADYMQLRHFHFQRLDGSIRGDARKDAIDHFNAEGSQDFCFLLSTRAGGLGVNLATADTVVIFDSDWNPQNDLQAQARAHRIGQKKQVNIYRLVTKNSVEEDIIERAKKKMVLDHLVIQRMDTTGRTVLSANKEPSKSAPFDKDELTAILKFGADELFKSGDGGEVSADKALQELDIDDILSRAEMQATAEDSSHSDLLSQFKVASFAMDEEELAPLPSATPTDGKTFLLSPRGSGQQAVVVPEKSWDELIPEEARKKIDEEEKTKEQLELYLPPRRRKVRNYCEDQSQNNSGKTRTRNTKPGAPPTKDSTGSCATVVSRNIRGFTDSEIRRFVKSYRKFVNPKARLGAIAADSELQEKSMSELQQLMTVLHEGCVQAEEEHRARIEIDANYDPKKDKGASLRLCGVTVGSGSLLRREEELAALQCVLPANPAVRKKYRLLSRPKGVNWSGVKWTAVDDAKLLIGIYEHGLGNWESIRDNANLGLTNKILRADPSLKPQASHLQTRVEYLLKLLQVEAAEKMRKKKSSKNSSRSSKKSSSHIALSKSPAKSKKTSRSPAPKKLVQSHLTVNISRDLLEGESDTGSNASGTRTRSRKRGAPFGANASPAKKTELVSRQTRLAANSRKREMEKVIIPGERTSPRKRKGRGDVEKRVESSVEEEEEGEGEREVDPDGLDDDTFKECKLMMKPIRKAMLELQPITEQLADNEPLAMNQFKKVVMEIGDHISTALSGRKPGNTSLWKKNLWVFVSKFTNTGPQELHRIYKETKQMGDTLNHSPAKVKHEDMGPKDRLSSDTTSQLLPPSHDGDLDDHSRSTRRDGRPPLHTSTKSADQAVNSASSAEHHKPSNEGDVGRDKGERNRDGQPPLHTSTKSADQAVNSASSAEPPNEGDVGRDKGERQPSLHTSTKSADQAVNFASSAEHHKPSSHSNEGDVGRDKEERNRDRQPSLHTSTKSADQAVNSGSSAEHHKPSSHSNEGDVGRNRHPSGGVSDHSYSSETGHRHEDERDHPHHHHHHSHHHHGGHCRHSSDSDLSDNPHHHSHHHHGDRHRHSSGGSHHGDRHCHNSGSHHGDRHRHNSGSSHHGDRRRRHSSGSSYYSDGGSNAKRPRYHSPPGSASHHSRHRHPSSSSSAHGHRHNSHSHCY